MNTILINIIFYFLKNTIYSKTKYHVIDKNEPIDKVNLFKLPCLYLIG